jgi:hypothetical protein
MTRLPDYRRKLQASAAKGFTGVLTRQEELDAGARRMAELDRLIAAGWGDVPGVKIPAEMLAALAAREQLPLPVGRAVRIRKENAA